MPNLETTIQQLEITAGGPGSGRHKGLFAVVGHRTGVVQHGFKSKEEANDKLSQEKSLANFGRAGGIHKGTDSPQRFKVVEHGPEESRTNIQDRLKAKNPDTFGYF